ncbi:MAG: GNAT family N-acetyltransferase [Prolixibacteraceae bacterium]|nr:GNAT family N-acetyltransferase [Prolixibacteraceae bacterium]
MNVTYRDYLLLSDREAIRELLTNTGVFYDFEIEVALELVDDFIDNGKKSGYYFYLAEIDGNIAGYVNFGPTPCTKSGWDLYWIAVRKDFHGEGIGGILIKKAEKEVMKNGGKKLWVETSSKQNYLPARLFYEKNTYIKAAELNEFYGPDDNKIIYGKSLKENDE